MRNLVLVLGDQLNHDSAVFTGFDSSRDAVWMAEVEEEATHVWCHKLRIAFFLSAMRHFREELRGKGVTVHYHELTGNPAADKGKGLAAVLAGDVAAFHPERLTVVTPGDYRVFKLLERQANALGIPLMVLPDGHFYCRTEEFREFAAGRKSLLLESFYRGMRRRHGVLLEQGGKPAGGRWNFDRENRAAFGLQGPPAMAAPLAFPPDAITRQVMALVAQRFAHHPGRLDHMNLPVTRRQAQAMLDDFVRQRLPRFGLYEDAMWTGEPFLFHSRLSAPLNVKLLDPRECVAEAVRAYDQGHAPLNSVEAFVRQVLGWREYVRGVYWYHMPHYQDRNFLDHHLPVPPFYWDGETDMECLRQTMGHVLDHGYAHHIHRLMVLGLFALLLGVHPLRFHEWHMAMYVDAVDWVSLPNTLGMSQYGDGGLVGSKPYCASGQYIRRMSDFCRHCRFDSAASLGDKACPFTTLYWDFLERHHDRLKKNPRLQPQFLNLARKRRIRGEMEAITRRADQLRRLWGVG